MDHPTSNVRTPHQELFHFTEKLPQLLEAAKQDCDLRGKLHAIGEKITAATTRRTKQGEDDHVW